MSKHKILESVLVVLIIILFIPECMAVMQPLKGTAVGTAWIQGVSGPEQPASMTFTNVGKQGSKADGVAILYIICDGSKKDCKEAQFTGTFSGGPNGVASFTVPIDFVINLQLHNGKTFTRDEPGAWVELSVVHPEIFDAEPETTDETAQPEEEALPEEEAKRDSGTRVSDIDGQAEIACPPNLDSWDVLKRKTVIYVDCHIKTGEDSSVELSFSDMTTFKMKPESEIVIDTPPEKESKMSLIAGNIWVNVKQMIKDGTMKVHGSQAVAGIKGTTFVMEEKNGMTALKVIEGVVDYQSNAGARTDVKAGESVSATAKGLGEKTSFDIEAESSSWEKKSSAGMIGIILIVVVVVAAGLYLLLGRKGRKAKKR